MPVAHDAVRFCTDRNNDDPQRLSSKDCLIRVLVFYLFKLLTRLCLGSGKSFINITLVIPRPIFVLFLYAGNKISLDMLSLRGQLWIKHPTRNRSDHLSGSFAARVYALKYTQITLRPIERADLQHIRIHRAGNLTFRSLS